MRVCIKPVFQAWLNGKDKKTPSMSSMGGRILSYNTPILWREDGKVVLNETKYSRTTSNQQTGLRVLLAEAKVEYTTVDNIKRGGW